MNTRHQVLNRKMHIFLLLKPNICKCKCKKKNKKPTTTTTTSHTEVHITEIPESSQDRKAGHACNMTKKGYILIELGQFEDETSLNSIRI